jgi:NhaP-type Na+/H+ or K+/H+ antiporter
MGIFAFRFFIIGLLTVGGYFYPPFKLNGIAGAVTAFFLGLLMMFLETRIRRAQFRVIWSAGLGLLLGVFLGWMLGSIYQASSTRRRWPPSSASFSSTIPEILAYLSLKILP